MAVYRSGIILIVAVLFWAGVACAGECTGLRIAGTDGWRPVTYRNSSTGDAEGIASDLVRHVAKELGLPVTLDISLPWKRLLVLVDAGRIDMISAIYWSKERAERYLYSEPFFHNEARVFVKRGREFLFHGFNDLQGRRGGRPGGGSFGEEFDTYAREHGLVLDDLKTKEQMTGKLLAGRIDYFIQDYVDGLTYLRSHDLLEAVAILPVPVSSTNVHMALSRQSPCAVLLPEINRIIEEARTNGTLQAIIDRNLR